MKTLFLMLFVVSIGVGQTREERGWPADTLSKVGTTVTIIQPQSREEKKENLREISRRIAKGEIVLHKPQPNFEIAHYDTAWHLSEDFWRAFAVKWREYEAWCADSVYEHPTFPGFILWLEKEEMKRLLIKFFDLCFDLAREMSRRDYPK